MDSFSKSSHGKILFNKNCFLNTNYDDENKISKKINNQCFKDLVESHENTYDVSIYVWIYKSGFAIDQLAKLRKLEFSCNALCRQSAILASALLDLITICAVNLWLCKHGRRGRLF